MVWVMQVQIFASNTQFHYLCRHFLPPPPPTPPQGPKINLGQQLVDLQNRVFQNFTHGPFCHHQDKNTPPQDRNPHLSEAAPRAGFFFSLWLATRASERTIASPVCQKPQYLAICFPASHSHQSNAAAAKNLRL